MAEPLLSGGEPFTLIFVVVILEIVGSAGVLGTSAGIETVIHTLGDRPL